MSGPWIDGGGVHGPRFRDDLILAQAFDVAGRIEDVGPVQVPHVERPVAADADAPAGYGRSLGDDAVGLIEVPGVDAVPAQDELPEFGTQEIVPPQMVVGVRAV